MPKFHIRVLRAMARVACDYPKAVLVMAGLLTVASWLPILLGGVDQAFNVARLLPQDVPAARDFTRVVTDFGSADEGVVVLRIGGADEQGDDDAARDARRALVVAENGTPGPLGHLADTIADRLRAQTDVTFRDVYCRMLAEDDRDFLQYEALARGGLLMLSPEDAARVVEALTPENIRQHVRLFANFRRNLRRDNDDTRLLAQFTTLGLRPTFLKLAARFRGEAGGADTDTSDGAATDAALPETDPAEGADEADEADEAPDDQTAAMLEQASGPGYLVDPQYRLLLISYHPDQAAQKMEYSKKVMAVVRREADAALAGLTDLARRRVRIEHSGGYEISIHHERNVYVALRDTFLTTLVGVLLLFGVAYRRPGVFLYVGLPLVIIVSWTVGLGFLLFGRLNMVSCAFAAVLVSLGVDYAIHLYNRYVEERRRGADVRGAFMDATEHTGWGIVMGMVTTVLAFLALLWTRFSQLSEFGLLVGIGLALSVPVMFFVLPALIALRHDRRAEHVRATRPLMFGLPALSRAVARAPRAFGLGGLALGALCVAGMWRHGDRMRFDERIDPLRPPMRALDVGADIAAAFAKRSGSSLMAVAYSDADGRAGEEAALDRAAGHAAACRAMMRETVDGRPALDAYESLTRYLPAPSEQRATLAVLRAVDWDAAMAALRDTTAESFPGRDFGFDADGGVAAPLMMSWPERRALFAAQRERAGSDRARAEIVDAQRTWLAYVFPLKLLACHKAVVEAERPLLISDFADTPLARHLARLVATRKREVDFREPLPADLAFPATLAVDAESRDGRVVAAAGTVYADAAALRALYDDPALEHAAQVRRAVLATPGWAVKTKLYPPVDPTTRAGDPLLGDAWVDLARARFDAPIPDPVARVDAAALPAPNAVLTGIPLLAHELAVIVKDDFRRLSVGVFAGAVLALALFFRRHPSRMAASLSVIVLGMLYMLGFMVLFGVRWNFVNILLIPILIGLGVDAGIHMVHRYFESGRDLDQTVVGTGRAIVITGLTSMIGFGSLGLGAYGGAAGMGALMVVGLLGSMVVSLAVLPGLLGWWTPKSPDADEGPTEIKY